MRGGGGWLGQRYGPLPGWAWLALAAGAALVYTAIKGASPSDDASTSASSSASVPLILPGLTSSSSASTLSTGRHGAGKRPRKG